MLGCFANGRLEQWLPVRNLDAHEMLYPAIATSIASLLCKFHQLEVPGLPSHPTLFQTIRKWFAKAMTIEFSGHQAQQYAQLDLPRRLAEFEELAALCLRLQPPTVFGHNDLLSGNVLVPREVCPTCLLSTARGIDTWLTSTQYAATPDPSAPSPVINFIDFEYSAPTYRGFDVGNHFNECAGFECKWEDYPDDVQAQHFARAYLQAGGDSEVCVFVNVVAFHQAKGEHQHPDQDDSSVARFTAEAHLFALISHVYWCVWAVLQAKWSAVDFDYLAYALKRWARLDDTKEQVVAVALDQC